MLSVKVESGHVYDMTVSGALDDVVMDIGSLINAIRHTLRRSSPEAAMEFRDLIQWLTADNSPLWKSSGELIGGSATVTTLRVDGKEK